MFHLPLQLRLIVKLTVAIITRWDDTAVALMACITWQQCQTACEASDGIVH